VRILLDENMPESLRRALADLGHEVDSVASLRLKGLDNGRLYQDVAQRYDLCFSRDRLFVHSVRAIDRPGAVRVLRVTLAQAPGGRFTRAFVEAFRVTDWSRFPNGSDWPG
jgi:predicted nuclease of predicted toxin-antitoxin system